MAKWNSYTPISGGLVADADLVPYSDEGEAIGSKSKVVSVGTLRTVLSGASEVTTTDPGVGDDSADGYRAGSIWLNTTDGGVFICEDASAGAAVWTEFSPPAALVAGDDAADLGSGAATDGYVLTADGIGGAAWEAAAAGGSSLAWYDVTDATYGATGDGTTDDTTAVQAAITAAEAAGGGVVYLPPGTYKLTSGLVMDGSNVTLQGDGLPSVLAPNFATGNIILAGTTTPSAVLNLTFKNFAINSTVARTADAAIYCQHAAKYTFEDVYIQSDAETVGFDRQYNGIVLDRFDNVVINRCRINMAHWGVYAFGNSDQTWGANLFLIGGGRIFGGQTTGSIGLILRGGTGGVTIEDTDFSQCGNAVYLDDDTATVKNREVFFNQCFFDDCGGHGIVVDAAGVETLQLDGCYISGAGTVDTGGGAVGTGMIVVSGQSATMKCSINGGRIWNCNGTGLYLQDGAFNINGVMVHDNGQGTGGGHGIFMDASVADVVINGCSITGNGDASVGYGIVTTSGMDNFSISDNLIRSNGQGQVNNGAGISSSKSVSGTIPGGWISYTPTWTASAGSITQGNATLVGEYTQHGSTVTARVHLTIGSTTVVTGSGGWRFALPGTAASVEFVGPAMINDVGTDNILAACYTLTTGVLVPVAEGGNTIGDGVPVTWATGDRVYASITYDLA